MTFLSRSRKWMSLSKNMQTMVLKDVPFEVNNDSIDNVNDIVPKIHVF